MTRRFVLARFPGRGVVDIRDAAGVPWCSDMLELGLVDAAPVRSPVAMAMMAMDGSLVRCNEVWSSSTGAFDEGELPGTSLAAHHPAARARRPEERVSTALRRATRRAGGASRVS